jgi:hypothetical protein
METSYSRVARNYGRIVLALILAGATGLGGCASITRGTTEALVIDSVPAGADVSVSNGMRCTSPCTLTAKHKDNLTIDLTKPGFKPMRVSVVSEIAGAGAAGMAGNVLLGGLIGAAIDVGTGATKHLVPNPVNVTLEADHAEAKPIEHSDTSTGNSLSAPGGFVAIATVPVEQMCDQVGKVARAVCQHRLTTEMTQNDVMSLLGTPTARNAEDTTWRYGEELVHFNAQGLFTSTISN